jgi:hypothetical protein
VDAEPSQKLLTQRTGRSWSKLQRQLTSLFLFLRLLRKQQRVHNFGAVPKICGLQPPKNRSQINQPPPGGNVEHSKRTCYCQALPKP